ncbi:MAG TPA: SAM-dependent methyltransferase [Ktedonobacterales bacterium]|jgi:SAM-dependent MidA family methyltransferase
MQQASTPVEAIIRERIAASGAITFAEYMDLALYHPQFGYYTAGPPKVGWSGDFFTSAHLHPLFGACIARQLAWMWDTLKRPAPFVALEEGAGQGVLAEQVRAFAQEHLPLLAEALRYQVTDIGQPAEMAPASPLHVILSNELIDAFPAHRVEARGGRLLEVYVVEREGRLVERLDEPSSEAVSGYLDRFAVPWRRFGDGWRAEINLRALHWMRTTAARLARGGFALTIDYGDTARRLYTRARRHGTLLCYYRHSINEEPLARPGQQDMTAHVNFSALIEEGRRAGLSRSRFTTQRAFLLGLGIREEMEALRARRFGAADAARHTDQGQADLLRAYSLRNAVSALLDPSGLGGFRVLMQRKTPASGSAPRA